MTPSRSLVLAFALVCPLLGEPAAAHSTRFVSMDDARVAMRTVGMRLSVKLDAADFSTRCYRLTSRRIHCDLIFSRTTVGDCSLRFHVTGHPGGTHVVRLRAKHKDDCPSGASAGR